MSQTGPPAGTLSAPADTWPRHHCRLDRVLQDLLAAAVQRPGSCLGARELLLPRFVDVASAPAVIQRWRNTPKYERRRKGVRTAAACISAVPVSDVGMLEEGLVHALLRRAGSWQPGDRCTAPRA